MHKRDIRCLIVWFGAGEWTNKAFWRANNTQSLDVATRLCRHNRRNRLQPFNWYNIIFCRHLYSLASGEKGRAREKETERPNADTKGKKGRNKVWRKTSASMRNCRTIRSRNGSSRSVILPIFSKTLFEPLSEKNWYFRCAEVCEWWWGWHVQWCQQCVAVACVLLLKKCSQSNFAIVSLLKFQCFIWVRNLEYN